MISVVWLSERDRSVRWNGSCVYSIFRARWCECSNKRIIPYRDVSVLNSWIVLRLFFCWSLQTTPIVLLRNLLLNTSSAHSTSFRPCCNLLTRYCGMIISVENTTLRLRLLYMHIRHANANSYVSYLHWQKGQHIKCTYSHHPDVCTYYSGVVWTMPANCATFWKTQPAVCRQNSFPQGKHHKKRSSRFISYLDLMSDKLSKILLPWLNVPA